MGLGISRRTAVHTVAESSVLSVTTIGACASAAKPARTTSLRKRRRTMHACEGGLACYLVALREPKTLHSRARNVSPPSHRKASEPLLQERADARERAPALRYDTCVEVPGMGHARPHLDFDVASRRFQFLGHADRVVA